MGRDKARLRLGGRTLLGHLRLLAAALGLPLRNIRRDLVPRSGPLGGIYTALKTTRVETIVFLACDMPFVSADLLRRMLRRHRTNGRALFTRHLRTVGFPFIVSVKVLPTVERLLVARNLSLQCLARALRAASFAPAPAEAEAFVNVNTPADWKAARRTWLQGSAPSPLLPADSTVRGGEK